MKSHIKNLFALLAVLALATVNQLLSAAPLGTAFNYQGKLSSGTNAASGSYDFSFALYDAAAGGTQQGVTQTINAVVVTNGYFNVALDFGNYFDGNPRWLAISVKTNGAGSYATLSPRIQLLPNPYALYAPAAGNAGSLTGTLPVAQVTGVVPVGQLPAAVVTNNASGVTLNGTFAGNGSGLTNLTTSGLATNAAILNTNQTFTGSNTFLGVLTATNGTNLIAGTFNGSGAGLTSLSAGALTGTMPAGLIGTAALADGAVTAAKLAPGTIPQLGGVSQLGTPDGSQTNALQVATNGLIGIGTNTPHAGVEIAGGASLLGPVVYAEVREGTGSFTNLAGANGVAFSTNLLAVASTTDNAITFIDTASDSFVYRSSVQNGQGAFTNLTSVQDVAFWTNRILAAAAPSANAVTIISLTNPAAPVWKSVLRDGTASFNYLAGANAVAFNDRMLAISAYNDNAVTLVSLTNPAAPYLLGYFQNGFNSVTNLAGPMALAFSGNLLAVAAFSSSAVILVDVSNPSSPVQRVSIKQGLNGFSQMSGPLAVAFNGNLLAIAAATSQAVNLVDVSNPASPVLKAVIGTDANWNPAALCYFQGGGRNLLAVTSHNFAADTIRVFDVTDPANPRACASLDWGSSGLHYLDNPAKVALNAGGRLAVAASGSSAVTLLGWTDQKAGLVSDTWVGIGTALPKAALDVNGDVLIENANRFQASASHVELGSVTAATGNYATAMGGNTSASGSYSTATGQGSRASGDSATALGKNTVAGGASSTAMGESTTASGNNSTALGYQTIAGGTYATALGNRAKALHDGTLVWADSQAADFASTANDQFLIRAAGGVGIGTNHPQSALHVAGTVTADAISGDGANALDFTVSGQRVLRLEPDTTGFGPNLIGGAAANIVSNGYYGATIGGGGSSANPNRAGGSYATVAGGYGNTASGTASTAMGAQSLASGNYSFAVGFNTFATSNGATAMGLGTHALGAASTAMGSSTTASNSFTLAAGYRAKAVHQGTFVWADSQDAEFSSTSSNQFLIRAGGGVGINQTNPTAALDVNGSVRVNDKDIFLRTQTDTNHGVGWYGSGKLFAGRNVDGPVLYGASGGALGTMNGGQKTSLSWDRYGGVSIPGYLDVGDSASIAGNLYVDGTLHVSNAQTPGVSYSQLNGEAMNWCGGIGGDGNTFKVVSRCSSARPGPGYFVVMFNAVLDADSDWVVVLMDVTVNPPVMLTSRDAHKEQTCAITWVVPISGAGPQQVFEVWANPGELVLNVDCREVDNPNLTIMYFPRLNN